MSIFYRYLIPALWLAWLAHWRISAAHVKAAQRVDPPWSRAAHLLPLFIAAVLLWIRTDPDGGWLFHRFLSRSAASFWIGALLTGIGLAFSVWARVHLGRAWRLARLARAADRICRAMAQAASRGALDERNLRRDLSALPRAHRSADPLPALAPCGPGAQAPGGGANGETPMSMACSLNRNSAYSASPSTTAIRSL